MLKNMFKKMSPETLQAMAKAAKQMEVDRQRQKEWIREFVTKAAEKELVDLSLPDRSRRTIKFFKDEFESCLASIIEDDGDYCAKVCALGAIEAAAAIMGLSRPDDDILKQVWRERLKPARNKRTADKKERDKQIAGLLRDIEKKGTPLKAGEIYIKTHILGKLPARICGKVRPEAGTIKNIIRSMTAGQL